HHEEYPRYLSGRGGRIRETRQLPGRCQHRRVCESRQSDAGSGHCVTFAGATGRLTPVHGAQTKTKALPLCFPVRWIYDCKQATRPFSSWPCPFPSPSLFRRSTLLPTTSFSVNWGSASLPSRALRGCTTSCLPSLPTD